MKLILTMTISILFSGLAFADGQTWDICEGNGASFSTRWHYGTESEVRTKVTLRNADLTIDTYSLYSKKAYEGGILTYENNLVILKINEGTCIRNEKHFNCDGEIKIINLKKRIKVKCEIEIPYTPATGSGGQCGGRRC